MNNIIKLSPLQKFCCTIGNLPSSYLVSLTYEEQILWLCNYLENTVIPTINQNGEAVTELQNLYVQLKNYVDNYFNDLNLQEEINNKIDELIENGQLINIIMSTINTFNTVDEMSSSNRLVNGSFAKTLGYFTKNDNGGAFYFISSQNLNDLSKININNNLYAYLVPDTSLNIRQFGINYNEADVTQKFQNLANYIEINNIENLIFNENDIINLSNIITFNFNNISYFKLSLNNSKINFISNIRYFNTGIINLRFNKDLENICIIENGNFDGSGVTPDFSSTNVNPNGGCGAIFTNYARKLIAKNCNFSNWFYSACIWSHFTDNAIIENCNGVNIGGRSATNDEDARGDALYFGYSGIHYQDETTAIDNENSKEVNIKILNCNFSSYTPVNNLYPSLTNVRNGSKSGRCGITFTEFSNSTKPKYLSIENSTFTNYQRTIHLENTQNCFININNCTFNEFANLLLINSINNIASFKITNSNFNRQLDIVPIYPNYDSIIAGNVNLLVNGDKIFSFYNCNFNMKSCYLFIYGMAIPTNFENCSFTTSNLQAQNNCKLNFKNCNINFNRTLFFKCLLNFEDCKINGGYLNNENTSYFLYNYTKPDFNDNYCFIKNCILNDVGVNYDNGYIDFVNNYCNYSSNFKSSLNAMFSFVLSNLRDFYNNTIINNSSLLTLFNTTFNYDLPCFIHNNTFNYCRLSLFNLKDYNVRIFNNTFIGKVNTDISIDLYGSSPSETYLNDNMFINMTTPWQNLGNSIRHNNYYVVNDTMNKLTDSP